MNIDSSHPSPNFSVRKEKIQFIILHYTAIDFNESLSRLTNPLIKVSSHYLISSNGAIYQLVSDDQAAWHAGISDWHNQHSLNESSIGIELENLGDSEFNILQLNACIELCQKLMHKYNIPKQHVLGHSDIAPDRKLDPGIYFDWNYLAKSGIGIWHDIDTKYTYPKVLYNFKDKSSHILALQDNLKTIGYKIEHTGIFDTQTNFVVRAFQSKYNSDVIKKLGLHFYRNEHSIYSWDDTSQKILLNLLTKIS